MKVIDDGVIKYDRSNFSYLECINQSEFEAIEYQREILYKLNLIGEEPEAKIGFGNISMKHDFTSVHPTPHPQFVITGTQTGKYSKLDGKLYTRVIDFDIDGLKLFSMGAVEASSEALTHAAIYLGNTNIKAVVHVHSKSIWEKMLADGSPSTKKDIPYGTKEMAYEAMRIAGLHHTGVFAMAGHEDGVIAFSTDIETATKLITDLHFKYLV